MGNFKEDIALTEAFVFDVDGVMTDGSIMPLPGGDFLRRYNAKDGYALAYAVRQGYRVCVITGGHGATLERRLQMLGVKDFYMDCMDKIAVMRSYFEREGIDPAHVIYMGDDIPDLECMRMVGIPVCPADAASEVIEAARYVSEFNGGRGAVRDIIEQVLRARGDWARSSIGVTPASMDPQRERRRLRLLEEDCRRSLPLDGDGRQTVEKDARAAEYSAVRRCIVPGRKSSGGEQQRNRE